MMALLAGGIAYAAGLGTVTTPSLGAAEGVVVSCDTNGLTITWGTVYDPSIAAYRVNLVTVSDIDASGCQDADIRLQLTGAGGSTLGPEKFTLSMNSVSFVGFAFAPTVKVEDLEDVHIVLIGP